MRLHSVRNGFWNAALLLCIAVFTLPAVAQSVREEATAADSRARPSLPGLSLAAPPLSPTKDPSLEWSRHGLSTRQERLWLLLGLAQHSAAFFDARTTRDAMKNYGELDPMLRPFAHSAALYPVMQIAPAGLDWLAIRFASSRHRWLRRIWWLPQSAAAAGFLWSGIHNMCLPAPTPHE